MVAAPTPAVDGGYGGDGKASVVLPANQAAAVQQMTVRTASDPSLDPLTGADLGSGSATKPR